jgi:hypothetical protein
VRDFDPRRDGGPLEPLVHAGSVARPGALLLILRRMLDRVGVDLKRFFALATTLHAGRLGGRSTRSPNRASRPTLRPAYGSGRRSDLASDYFFPPSVCRQRVQAAESLSCAGWSARTPSTWACGRHQPGAAVVPLDTHVIRLGRCLKLTPLRVTWLEDGR